MKNIPNELRMDFKVTVWQTAITSDPNTIKAILEVLENGGELTGDNLYDYGDDYDWDDICETEEYMTVTENNEEATVEVYNDNVPIWNNKDKTLINVEI